MVRYHSAYGRNDRKDAQKFYIHTRLRRNARYLVEGRNLSSLRVGKVTPACLSVEAVPIWRHVTSNATVARRGPLCRYDEGERLCEHESSKSAV